MSTAAARVAPDLSRFDARPQVREVMAAEAPSIRALPVPRTRTAAVAQTQARLSIRSVLIFLCVIALMMFIVYSYMQMAEMSRISSGILNEINALKKEERTLLSKKADLIDPKEIERIAEEELGMVRPSDSQIIYIDLSGEDHAEVLGD